MKVNIPIILLISITQVIPQSRKDLISEYKKYILNEDHLGIQLNRKVYDHTNQEISTILDSVWTKKKSIILLRLLGYLENPKCGILIFSDNELEEAVNLFKGDTNIDSAINDLESFNQLLFNSYLNSENKHQLPYMIRKNKFIYDNLDILFVVYKSELEFQIWVKSKDSKSPYSFIANYPITNTSVANAGPKSKYGDMLTPEGIYSVNYYPSFRWSDYHLSFRVSYPNKLDHARRRHWGIGGKAGGDINIHGFCISIGCIPLGNPVIDELFFLTRINQITGSNISIMIFPFKFDNNSVKNKYYAEFRNNYRIIDFWDSLEKCQKYFIRHKMIPELNINEKTGYYFLRSK